MRPLPQKQVKSHPIATLAALMRNENAQLARLALEDGTVFHGTAFGATKTGTEAAGEVVFNTAMCGYQEALTDPSYSGQILTMTATQIGNYGIAAEDIESGKPQVRAFVVRELARLHSNYRAETGVSEWLAQHGIPGIAGIDTRALVRKLRTQGALRGVVMVGEGPSDAELVARAKAIPSMAGQNLAACVSPAARGAFTEDLGAWSPGSSRASGRTFVVAALDCGAKRNIYRNLVDRGCEVITLPHDAKAADIRALKADGLFNSNGPGDPAVVQSTISTLREIAGEIPTFGICLGHQLLALALGATTWKLKFGHRGSNQPVRNLLTGRVEITSQNHGFCVDENSLRAAGGEPTHVHLNDGTLAGFRHTTKPIFCVQYHPEASPGPHDSSYLFDCFIDIMQSRKPVTAEVMEKHQSAAARAAATVAV
jgi:carbamoyl-phosphate synthase small subunit